MTDVAAEQRRKELAYIHVLKRDLGMDDNTYRDALHNWVGVRSAGDLDGAGRMTFIDRMKRQVGTRKQRRDAMPIRANNRAQRMIVGLWLELHDLGAVHNRSERAVNAFCKRQTGVERLVWMTPYTENQVIEALKSWRDRVLEKRRKDAGRADA